MKQKRVSFKVAQVVKEAGYPQISQRFQYTYECTLVDLVRDGGICYGPVAPTYLDVWLWLWREKDLVKMDVWDKYINDIANNYIDPEEAIIAAIEYLVDNELIK